MRLDSEPATAVVPTDVEHVDTGLVEQGIDGAQQLPGSTQHGVGSAIIEVFQFGV